MVLTKIKNYKYLILLTLIFFVYLFFFSFKTLSTNLGIFSYYIYEFNSLNELSFWSSLSNIPYSDINFLNPIKYNIVAILINFLSNYFSNFIIFTVFPIIFTTLSFYFFLLILNFYRLDIVWSFLISFLGLTSFSSFPLFSILINFFTFENINNIPSGYFDLLISFNNSFLLLFFLIIFYVTLKVQSTNTKLNYYISFLWCFSIFLHPSIFIFGFTFWFINIFIKQIRNKIKGIEINYKFFLFYSIFPLLIVLPYFFLNYSFYSFQNISNNNTEINFISEVLKPIILYFISPLFLFLICSKIFKIDPFESLVKYWPIMIISILEILLRILNFYGLLQINSEIILDRISIYFLHFFYYVPFLSIISKRFSYLPDINITNRDIYYYSRKFFSFLGITIRIPILIFFLFVVTYYSYFSVQKNDLSFVNNHSKKIKNEYIEIKSNPKFKNKEIFYTSLDNNLIISYFGFTDIKFNSFLYNGSLHEKKNEVLQFLNFLYSKNQISNEFSYKAILADSTNLLYYKNYQRQNALLNWLIYNHNFTNNQLNIPNNYNQDLLNEYVIVSDYNISSLENFDYILHNSYYIYHK